MLRYNQYKNYNNQQQKTASKSCIFFKINLGYIHNIYLILGVTAPKN